MDLQPRRIPAKRRNDIFEFLETRVATTGQIGRKFFRGPSPETSRKKASRFLCRQRRRKRIFVRGFVTTAGIGRPDIAYGQECKEDNLEHEVWLTEAELLMGVTFDRNAQVGKTTADAKFVKDGETFWVELDNETMNLKQMREKWLRYENVREFILVICHRKSRLRLLRKSAGTVIQQILFTRFRWLRSIRVKEPWIDGIGKRVGI